MGALDETSRQWLPSVVDYVLTPLGHTARIRLDLTEGTAFRLVIANDHPDGDHASRLVIKSLTGSIEPKHMLAVGRRDAQAAMRMISRGRVQRSRLADGAEVSPPVSIAARVRRSLRWIVRPTFRVLRRMKRIVPGRLRRLIDRARARIVHHSPEYGALLTVRQGLESELRRLSELGELAHLQKLFHEHRPDDLHLNACGDFQLMAREHWFALQGYPEFQMFSMNIDGLFSSIAYYAGIRERSLESPCHIFHLEHEKGSGWTPEGDERVTPSNRGAGHHMARRQGRVRVERVHALAQAADDLQHVRLGLRRRRTGGDDR